MVVLVIVVTIKNESPVEMVLNSTCESSCFLVTKIFNKLVFLLSAIRDCVTLFVNEQLHTVAFQIAVHQ